MRYSVVLHVVFVPDCAYLELLPDSIIASHIASHNQFTIETQSSQQGAALCNRELLTALFLKVFYLVLCLCGRTSFAANNGIIFIYYSSYFEFSRLPACFIHLLY